MDKMGVTMAEMMAEQMAEILVVSKAAEWADERAVWKECY